MIIVLTAFLIPMIVSVLCDLQFSGGLVWSGYVVGALVLAYLIVVLPMWFKKPNPVIFVPSDFAAVILYLLYINLATGGNWFLPFALPVLGYAALVICAVVILLYYLRCAHLYIFGAMSMAFGFYSIFVEMLIHINFAIHEKLVWSIYPAVTLFLIGIMLIVIAIVRPFRESLKKIFMI